MRFTNYTPMCKISTNKITLSTKTQSSWNMRKGYHKGEKILLFKYNNKEILDISLN